MAKLSVLDIVQDIMSDMNSDDVSSITDTVESMQVAQIVKSTYMDMMSRKNWEHLKQLTKLQASGTPARPTHMKVQEDIKEVISVNYNKQKSTQTAPRWREVQWLSPDDFLRYTNGRSTDSANIVQVEDVTGVALIIKNDAAPAYYTSFDDEYVVFDSYDSNIETTLQNSKTQVSAYIMPTFVLSDTHIPDLPAEMFSVLLAEAKSVSFARIKQMPDAKAEQQSRKGMSWASQRSFQINGGWDFPNYGRSGKK